MTDVEYSRGSASVASRLIVMVFIAGLYGTVFASAQSTRDPGPFDGVDALAIEASFGGVTSGDTGDLIPSVNPAIDLGSLSGSTRSLGLFWDRPMPRFFISRPATTRIGLVWMQLNQATTGTGTSNVGGEARPTRQTTRISSDILALRGGIRVSTAKRGSTIAPTVNIGGTFGHQFPLRYQTDVDPDQPGLVTDRGFPAAGGEPDRRYFYASLDVGVGLRIALGLPDESIALVPEVTAQLPLTSLTREVALTPIGLRAAVGLRVPIR